MMLAAEAEAASSSNTVLVLAALLGIATVVVTITWLKVHPFLALILGSAVLGLVAGFGPTPTVEAFTKGVGSTVGSVGLLIALGAMIGGLLADSGGADRIVQTIVEKVSPACCRGRWPAPPRWSASRCSSRSAWCCWCRSCCWSAAGPTCR